MFSPSGVVSAKVARLTTPYAMKNQRSARAYSTRHVRSAPSTQNVKMHISSNAENG